MSSTPSDSPTAAQAAASRALLARASRNSGQIVLPLNASAAAPHCAKPALYCVHSISGSGGSDFLPLARRLDGAVRVFGVQAPPGRMHDADFGASVVSLAAVYAAAIAKTHSAGAVVLAGWSAGAVIALEIAHQLRARGLEVSLLVAFDGAPENIAAGLRPWDPRYGLAVLARLPAWFQDMRTMEKRFQAPAMLRRIRGMAGRLRRALLLRKTEGVERIEGIINLEGYRPAERQFMARLYDAILAYHPASWDGPLILYEARVAAAFSLPQHLARWRRVAPRAQAVRMDGNHITIMREPRIKALAQDLEARIQSATCGRRAP